MNQTNQAAKTLGFGYLFHYNDITEKWSVFGRDQVSNYFNGFRTKAGNVPKLAGTGDTIEEAIEDYEYVMRKHNETSTIEDKGEIIDLT